MNGFQGHCCILWSMGPKKIGNNFRKSINPLTIIHVLTRLSSRTVPSREVPGRSQDGTRQDLETLKVPGPKSPWTKEVQKSRDFFWRSRDFPVPFFPFFTYLKFGGKLCAGESVVSLLASSLKYSRLSRPRNAKGCTCSSPHWLRSRWTSSWRPRKASSPTDEIGFDLD